MREVKTIFFDLDGVLIDSFRDVADSFNFVLTSQGLPEKPYAEVREIFGFGLSHLLAQGMGTKDEKVIAVSKELFNQKYQEICLTNTGLFPQVPEILAHYKEKNLAVVTNKPERFAKYILQELQVAAFFRDILGPESLQNNKPHPEGINTLLAKYETEPGQAVMVGDSAVDIYAGKAAGVITCGVTYGFGISREILKSEPEYTINSLAELKDIFS